MNNHSLELEAQRRQLQALYQADEYLHRHLELDQVLQALVDVVTDILGADKAAVMVWNPAQERLIVRAARGFSAPSLARMSFRPGEGVAGRVFLNGETITVEDLRHDPSVAHAIAAEEGICSLISVPILINDQVYGVFGMNYCQPRTFSAEDRRLFAALAQRAGQAIQNAHLYEQSKQAAALTERQRLARDLHDSVTQALYSLTLLAEAGKRQAQTGNLERVQEHMDQLGSIAQQALKEMRLLVYQLRPLALEQEGLVVALQQRLDAVEKRAGVRATIEVTGAIHLPSAIEDELYRIAMEALNNSLKHAAASAVTVRIRTQADEFVMEIEDNGRGIDPSRLGRGGVGVGSMQERTTHLGGTFSIHSPPHGGTCVQVVLNIAMYKEDGSL
ncbi:MAG: GAF domain-containing sensor histidine kinase [Caldilineaceae bacterium]|nr:GAF domain-containing sensor histidine kinase [Caldilineaceae bacterium]